MDSQVHFKSTISLCTLSVDKIHVFGSCSEEVIRSTLYQVLASHCLEWIAID